MPNKERKLGVHVVIDADTIERARLTGHPRLLVAVLAGAAKEVLQDVHIEALKLSEPEALEANPEAEA